MQFKRLKQTNERSIWTARTSCCWSVLKVDQEQLRKTAKNVQERDPAELGTGSGVISIYKRAFGTCPACNDTILINGCCPVCETPQK